MAGGLLLVVRSGSRRLSAKLRAQQAMWGIVDAGVFVRGRGGEPLMSMTEGSARQPAGWSAAACAKKRQIASVASGPWGSV
jgi:hypothetical protein